MPQAWIVEAARTPIGKHGGALASVRPDDLLAHVLSALMERSGVPKEEVEDVYAGCANQAGEDNRNVPVWPSSSRASPWRWRGAP